MYETTAAARWALLLIVRTLLTKFAALVTLDAFIAVGRSVHPRCCATRHQTRIGTLAESYCSCRDWLHHFVRGLILLRLSTTRNLSIVSIAAARSGLLLAAA
jgi:hypothetical protein